MPTGGWILPTEKPEEPCGQHLAAEQNRYPGVSNHPREILKRPVFKPLSTQENFDGKVLGFQPRGGGRAWVERTEAGECPLALSSSERTVASIIYGRPEWRKSPYAEMDAALRRLGEWRDATLVEYLRVHGRREWNKEMVRY